jgi:hypothetical protein
MVGTVFVEVKNAGFSRPIKQKNCGCLLRKPIDENGMKVLQASKFIIACGISSTG